MTEADYLRAIVADPDDNTLRLVYGDWLDEHPGEVPDAHERAAFIRGQVELARVPQRSNVKR